MPRYLKPSMVFSSVLEIPFRELFDRGVRHFVFDLDNTLVRQGGTVPDRRIVAALEGIVSMGSKVYFASNNPKDRSNILPFPVQSIHPRSRLEWLFARKPFKRYYRKVLKMTGAESPLEVVMIGDKYVKDINGARQVGMLAVLVNPIGRDLSFDRYSGLRWRENRLLRKRFGIARPA